MAEKLKIVSGTRVIVDELGEGVVLREAVSPRWPEDQEFSAFEVEIQGRWRKKTYWRNHSYFRVVVPQAECGGSHE